MRNMIVRHIPWLAFLLATGCTSTQVVPLVYAKNVTVGINVSAAGGANPDFTVGFRSQNLAIVPAYDGEKSTNILATVGGAAPQDTDALSVLGQFSADTKASGVVLGEFFATGVAAQKLADGFACEVSDGKAPNCK